MHARIHYKVHALVENMIVKMIYGCMALAENVVKPDLSVFTNFVPLDKLCTV